MTQQFYCRIRVASFYGLFKGFLSLVLILNKTAASGVQVGKNVLTWALTLLVTVWVVCSGGLRHKTLVLSLNTKHYVHVTRWRLLKFLKH